MATRRQYIDKRLVGVTLLVQRLQIHAAINHRGVERGVDTANHRCQVRHEGQPDILPGRAAQPLANLRQMAVTFNRVGLHAFAGLTEQRADTGAAPGATDARLAVGNQRGRIGQPLLQQRQETQLSGGRVATGHGNQARLLDRLAVDLRQAVDGLRQQFRRAMRLAVPLGPFFGILQAEVGGQIDHLGASGQQLTGQGMRHAMRSGKEHHVAAAEGRHVRHAESQAVVVAAQIGVHVGDLDALFRTRGDHRHFRLRVLRQQTQQLHTGVARAADDTDLDHAAFPPGTHLEYK